MQGPAQLSSLAGGVETGDIVGGAGAEPGAGSVCVPALPNLWDVGMHQKLGRQKQTGPHTPRTPCEAGFTQCLSPSQLSQRFGSGLTPQPPELACLTPSAPKLADLEGQGTPFVWPLTG